MPAGTYYIGDLCYIIRDELWQEVCDKFFGDIGDTLTLSDGRRIAMMSTAYGDGTYYDQHSNVYDVDSGTLGCVAVDIPNLEFDAFGHAVFEGDNYFKFDEPFIIDYQIGTVVFGNVRIDTSGWSLDEEGFDDDEEYYDDHYYDGDEEEF